MTPLRHTLRTAARLVASGALTAAVAALAGGLSPAVTAFVMAAWTALVTYCQTQLEDKGKVRPLFAPPPPT